jgi:uncharacterized protein YwgA
MYKLILSIILFLCLVYPVYKLIYALSVRKLNQTEFEKNKRKLQKKSIFLGITISFSFSLLYCFKVI